MSLVSMDIQIIEESDKWILMGIYNTFKECNKSIHEIIKIDQMDLTNASDFADAIIKYTWSYSIWVDGKFGGLMVLTHDGDISYEIQFHQVNHSPFKVLKVAKACIKWLENIDLPILYVRIPEDRTHIIKLCKHLGFIPDGNIIDEGYIIMSISRID